MELETSVINIAETCYIRIPASMAKFFKLKDIKTVRIKDVDESKAEILFP